MFDRINVYDSIVESKIGKKNKKELIKFVKIWKATQKFKFCSRKSI